MYEYRNQGWLKIEYLIKKRSMRDIGKQFNTSAGTICYWLRKYHIPTRAKLESMQPISVRKRIAEARMGNKNPGWKGGIRKTGGYIKEIYKDHPRADEDGYVFQHVLIAEKMIGRHLKKGEVVHHINTNRSDNRPENLMVMMNGEHLRMHKDMKSNKE